MSLPEKKDQTVTLDNASKLTASYRKANPGSAIKAAGFWRESVQKILDQPGCVALRAYFGQNPDGSPALVLVGVDQKGDDLTAGVLSDEHFPCPPFCAAPNPLNS